MRFEWDDAKREANLQKPELDFVGIEAFFDGYTVTMEDQRFAYGEQRFVTFGVLEGRVVTVVHTEHKGVVRVISMRKATRREEKSYFSRISD